MDETLTGEKILITGGTGFIGSHTCVALIERGMDPVILDNLSNSNPLVLDRIARITGRRPSFHHADVRDQDALVRIFDGNRITAVIHFAGLKAIGESVEKPLHYYQNNVEGARALFEVMNRAGVRTLIFSSSATVYGTPLAVPIPEAAPIRPVSPYGETKAAVERILEDMHAADASWHIGILRYFNPVGAHASGLIGEDPRGVPENLMPYIAQVAAGKREYLRVFGGDYPTQDGTGVRDYIHVMDLAEAHVTALHHLTRNDGLFAVNLGTGRGYSVLEMVAAFERATGRRIPYRILPRRPGDIAVCYADVGRATALFGWNARFQIDKMCEDLWRWQECNPGGYSERFQAVI